MLIPSDKKETPALSYYFCWISAILVFLVATVIWLHLVMTGESIGNLSFQVLLPVISFSFAVLIIFSGFFLGFNESSIFTILSCLISFFTFLITRRPVFLLNIFVFSGIMFFLYQEKEREIYKRSQEIIEFEHIREDFNTLRTDHERQKFLTFALKKRFEKFSQLSKIAEMLSYTVRVEEIINLLASKCFELIGKGERLKIFLTKEGQEDLVLRMKGEVTKRGLKLEGKERLRQEDIFDCWVAQNRQGLLVAEAKNDFRFQTEGVEIEANSLISYPFLRGHETLGLLRLESVKTEAFSVEDLRLLSILSDLAAASLENAYLYQKTEYLATVDGLTNLYVRGQFEEFLLKLLKTASVEHKPFSILMIDIDRFKDYNDTYGHIVGDTVLKKIANFLRQKIGEKGTVSRFGGEEFTVLLPNTEKDKAIDIAEDIQISLEREIIYVRRKETRITVSIGVASFPSDGITREGLLKKVDDALLKAKREGRNKVCAA